MATENQTKIDMMTEINKKLISELFDRAVVNPRLRQSFDLRNPDDNGQRMLNALMPGTVVPIHRHPMSNESVIILCGKLIEITNDDNGIRWRCWSQASSSRRRMGSTGKTARKRFNYFWTLTGTCPSDPISEDYG